MKITPQAREFVATLLQDHPGQRLRVAVEAGGCSGFSKKFEFSTAAEDDHAIDELLLIDPASWEILSDAELVLVNTLAAKRLDILVPMATANCGCGQSFGL